MNPSALSDSRRRFVIRTRYSATKQLLHGGALLTTLRDGCTEEAMRCAALLLACASAYAPVTHRGPSRIVAPRVLNEPDVEEAPSKAPQKLKRVARAARPTVAIIGRPNVGKSTLVNRFTDAGRGGAIAVDEVGVTRDRVYQRAEWCGRVFDVVDTGGLLFDDEESSQFLEEIREQASLALRESCCVVVVVDGRSGIVRTDEDIAGFLRKWPSTIETVLAVNKCESPEKEAEMVADFWPLGIGDPLACSAIHGYGVAEILDACLPSVDAASWTRPASEGKPGSATARRP